MSTRCCVYARKSTSQEKASEEARSTTRQVELARSFITQQGWTVSEEHVYIDEAISGGEFKKRPGLAALLAAAKTTPRPFDVVVMMAQSRLARRMRYAVDILHDLADAGVRIFFYQTGQERKLDTATNRFMGAVDGFADESYRENIRVTTRETLRQKAKRGEVGGGRVLGYRNVGEKGSRRREVDPEQAAIVAGIFTMAAEGKGLLRIAKTLNTEGIKNPTGQDRAKPGKRSDGWSPTGIRAILHRRLYLGEVVYGRTTWEDRGETKVKVPVQDESQWVVHHDERLRIVSDAEWQRAHTRMKATHEVYLRRTNGRLHGKPLAGLAGKYLLSGLLRCKSCGSSLMLSRSTGQRGRPTTHYVCSGRRSRPGTGCQFARGVPTAELEAAVLDAIREDFLDSEELQDQYHAAQARWREAPAAHAAEREAITARLATLDVELRRLVAAIIAGKVSTTITKAIEEHEAEQRSLQAKLEALDARARRAATLDPQRLQDFLTDLVDSLVDDLGQTPAKSHQTLSRLLSKPIIVSQDGPRAWSADIEASFAKLGGEWADVRVSRAVGDEKCPRGDSRGFGRCTSAAPCAGGQ